MEPEKKSNGALVGLVVIVIILIIGGIYMWQSSMKDAGAPTDGLAQTEALSNQDAAALEALDLEAESIDAEAGVDVEAVN